MVKPGQGPDSKKSQWSRVESCLCVTTTVQPTKIQQKIRFTWPANGSQHLSTAFYPGALVGFPWVSCASLSLFLLSYTFGFTGKLIKGQEAPSERLALDDDSVADECISPTESSTEHPFPNKKVWK